MCYIYIWTAGVNYCDLKITTLVKCIFYDANSGPHYKQWFAQFAFIKCICIKYSIF